MAIDWHYPRTDLTERLMSAFDQRVVEALTLFAPRGMGKTEFVRYDLIPEAGKRGYVPVYVNFRDKRDDPASVLLAALRTALSDRNWWRRRQRVVKAASLDEVESAVLATESPAIAPDSTMLVELRAHFLELIQNNDRILLCIDEVQHLASSRAFENLVFFLRTILDENRDKVRTIYAGASRDGLRNLFCRRKAALFQSSSQIELPTLGSGFIEHMRSSFQQASGRDFSHREGNKAFDLLNRVPKELRLVIEKMILSGADDIVNEAAVLSEGQLERGDYEKVWKRLKGLD
ncbi:AAA domain-containing protein [Tamilnaduibacter salinus]|uniref:AAA domain-containing protein n=1 Tax=Tamilnaduibacter salinus TaxID=1484056 RepID=A0A2U1CX81_9GAMM|nr:AAA family ATPase [Tamilnaduibacter salinus]PVY76864.1 AAA domain-containing protein [Tamilnaduibacter salinus]